MTHTECIPACCVYTVLVPGSRTRQSLRLPNNTLQLTRHYITTGKILKILPTRHPIAHQGGPDRGHLLWVQLPMWALCCKQYLPMLPQDPTSVYKCISVVSQCHKHLGFSQFYSSSYWRVPLHTVMVTYASYRARLVAWPAPSHYLNQCWNIVNWTLSDKLQWNLKRNSNIFIQEVWKQIFCIF